MSKGFIQVHRQILDNPIVCKDSDHFAIWNYLLLQATYTDRKFLFKGKKITLKPGQLITGRKSISALFKCSESKAQRVLKALENEQQIEQQTSNKNRLITILNWSKYQLNEQQSKQQVNNNRTTSEQQVNTNNKVNKDNKERKKEINIDFEVFWNLYDKKKGSKPKCLKKWNSLKDDVRQKIIDTLPAFKKGISEKQFQPLPSTYLNDERWNDELDERSKQQISIEEKKAAENEKLIRLGKLNDKNYE